jgi:hypothetical protein
LDRADQLPSADWLSAVKDEDEEVLLKTYSKPNPMAKVQEEILREWAGGREEHTSPRVLPVAVKHAGSTAGPQHLEHTSADAATEVEAEVEAEVEVAAEVEAKVAAEAEVAAQLAAQAELDAEAAAEAEPEVEEEGQVEGNEATALPNPVVEDVGAVGDGEGGATEDEGERREWTDAQKARARMWSLVRPQGVSKFINLDMISDSCQLLAGLSQVCVPSIRDPYALSSLCRQSRDCAVRWLHPSSHRVWLLLRMCISLVCKYGRHPWGSCSGALAWLPTALCVAIQRRRIRSTSCFGAGGGCVAACRAGTGGGAGSPAGATEQP